MAQIGSWNGHKFEVSPTKIESFADLTLKGSCETEDKEVDSEKFVSRKGGKPTETSLTVHLNARLGVDVRSECEKFVSEAQAGKTSYFYVGSKKLVTCQMMLTDASVSGISIMNNGKWVKADVKLTMKQCSKADGTTTAKPAPTPYYDYGYSPAPTTSKKASVKKTTTTTATKTSSGSLLTKVAQTVKSKLTDTIAKAQASISKLVSGAKAATKSTTTTTPKVINTNFTLKTIKVRSNG